MNRWIVLPLMTSAMWVGMASTTVRADGKLSSERLDVLDHRGYFTPTFKAAVHDLVDTQEQLDQVTADKAKLSKDMPGLHREAAESQAQAVALRQELAKYNHPEENDFDALEDKMKDESAAPADQLVLAQAYVWTYPTSPHEAEARQYLLQIQKKMADARQAQQESDAARTAAHAKLVQRARAKDLSLSEWRDFLRGMSQDDLVKLIGQPTSQTGDYWIYSGEWVTNSAIHQKHGLQINFDAGRVLNVDEKPSPP